LEIKYELWRIKKAGCGGFARRNVGGFGSGRRPAWLDGKACKETTEDYFALDIRAAKRHDLISVDQEEIPGIARIVWISAGFGTGEGHALRPWFLCPREGCQRRVAILYENTNPTIYPAWACRMCLDLCYPVERENRVERAIRRMQKARAKLGPGDTKPKRMRHETFVRLGRKYLEARKELVEAQRERLLRTLEQMEQEKIKYDL
jgi:hypothetical protein